MPVDQTNRMRARPAGRIVCCAAKWREVAVCALLLAWAGVVHAVELVGRVVGVADGDTITLLTPDKQQHKIRIAGIDAPERGQQGAHWSKESLAKMVYEREVRAECPKRDRYRRRVCKVWVQPSDCGRCGLTLDVGLAQISMGRAWWYREYAREQSPEDRGATSPRRTRHVCASAVSGLRTRLFHRGNGGAQFNADLAWFG